MLSAKITFYSMLTNLVSAGLSLDRALSRGIPRPLRRTCGRMRQQLLTGVPLSTAMCAQQRVFSSLEIALVTVGEATGTLDQSTAFLRDHFTRLKQLRSLAITSLTYPAFTYVVAIPLIAIAELATSQIGTGGLSLSGWGPVILQRCLLGWGLPLLLLLILKYFLPNIFRTSLAGSIINVLPLLGGLQHSYNSAIFWNTFGTCLRAGLPYGKAIELAAEACPSAYYAHKFKYVGQTLRTGDLSFSEAFEQHATGRDERCQFTALVTTGEATGHLDDASFRLGNQCEESTQTTLKRVAVIFPLVLYLALAGYLAFKIIGFYASYFTKILSL